MNLSAIRHRAAFNDCYALSDNEVVINIHTGKDITAVYIIHEDPYIRGISAINPWKGKREKITSRMELEHSFVWSIKLTPKFKRLQYYFELQCGRETAYLYENKIISGAYGKNGRQTGHYFKFSWLNTKDIISPPDWVKDIVWYQIFPDRFNRGKNFVDKGKFKAWKDTANITYRDFYGGNIKGIEERLDYIKNLGCNGIYMTPIFKSGSNHKYNTYDYEMIDPEFGSEEDIKSLVTNAHKKGIKIMLDAVFNHCGKEFFAWRDVIEKGEKSPYYNWFYINQSNFIKNDYKTRDGRYYSFAFEAGMPKLNTNNDEVIDYLTGLCMHWVRDYGIDGIRFDVGDEISHYFLKKLHSELKKLKPDIFLLGEIWIDSIQWLTGDEYDSVMNYPLFYNISEFWNNKSMTTEQLMYSVNYSMSLYTEQTNGVLFNFLDNHDTGRAIECCENTDVLLQKLIFLMTMPGTPCIYYGTEIAMPGKCDPHNRRPMPWNDIDFGKYDDIINEVKTIINLRRQYNQFRSSNIVWEHKEEYPRLVTYCKLSDNADVPLQIALNAGDDADLSVSGEIIYSKNYADNVLKKNGMIIYRG